jgi:polyene glycosyltransferase
VRIFVTHGGGNGFHEGIYFEKPLLVMPFWLACFYFAVRAVDGGVGLTPSIIHHNSPPGRCPLDLSAFLLTPVSRNGLNIGQRGWVGRRI